MIQLKNSGKKSVIATARNHEVTSDVSAALGGDDLGMNPHELLEAALAACTSITVQMYARRRGIALEDTKVEVHTVSEGAQSVISRKIEFVGTLTVEEKAKLLEIANKCPIHKLLESQIKIETQNLS